MATKTRKRDKKKVALDLDMLPMQPEGGKAATVFPPLNAAQVQLAAIAALTEFAQKNHKDRTFTARSIPGDQLPAAYGFALRVIQGYCVVGLTVAHTAEMNDVLAALVKLAAGFTSPEWNREHVVRKGG